jgi:hypothetical protein
VLSYSVEERLAPFWDYMQDTVGLQVRTRARTQLGAAAAACMRAAADDHYMCSKCCACCQWRLLASMGPAACQADFRLIRI